MKKLIAKSIAVIIALCAIGFLLNCTIRDWSMLTCTLDKVYYLIAEGIALLVVVFLSCGIASMFDE